MSTAADLDLPLTEDEAGRLIQAEQTIRQGLQTFVEVGQALTVIRSQRLYRQTHTTFEAYCSDEWNLSSARARQLIAASDVVEKIESVEISTPLPTNEGQAKALVGLTPADAAATMQRAHDTTNGKPTARAIREARPFQVVKPAPSAVPARTGQTEWSRRVQAVSANCPMPTLTDEEVLELKGAADFLRNYCEGELITRRSSR